MYLHIPRRPMPVGPDEYEFLVPVKLIKRKPPFFNMLSFKRVNRNNFEDFEKLHQEFVRIYRKLSRYKIEELQKQELKKEFDSRFGIDKFFYFATDGKSAVGYIFGCIERSNYGDYGYIDDIFVSKKYQGRGISGKLKDMVFDDLKRKGVKYCRIDVNPENKNAIQRYRGWGFEIDKLRMTRRL